jgi:hypothetical protein
MGKNAHGGKELERVYAEEPGFRDVRELLQSLGSNDAALVAGPGHDNGREAAGPVEKPAWRPVERVRNTGRVGSAYR